MNQYRIDLFAAPRDACGHDAVTVSIDSPPTAAELLEIVGRTHPELEPWTRVSRLAVNDAYVAPDRRIEMGESISLIPPVSGG